MLCSQTWRTVLCLISSAGLNSLDLEVLHQNLHVPQLSLQLDLLTPEPIQLSAQVGNVGLEHAVNVGTGDGLILQEGPFGLKHFVLLLQETDLKRKITMFRSIVSWGNMTE